MVTNTKADAHTTFKIPEDALVEVGMIYSVSPCVSKVRSDRAGLMQRGLLLRAGAVRQTSGVGAAAPDSSRDLVPAWWHSTGTAP